jgi:hypothetical protein
MAQTPPRGVQHPQSDGGYFGGCIKPANQKEYRRDRRLARNQNGKRKLVVIVRDYWQRHIS